ncbi:ABC1 kinase family protein [Kiloniella sp. b19]|uniref:ABC1 kinase family protein n=1 Tax=Kiloniella sp. GXU_MW_B19 TaxID=3141326 RepID=UPI0031CFD278
MSDQNSNSPSPDDLYEDDPDHRDIDDNRANVGGRLKRFAKVGVSVGGLAAQVAGNRVFGMSLDRDKHSSELKAALGGLKGPLMKAAQILATIPDALPKEYAEELRQLQSNAPSMGWLFVKRRMRSELGMGWQKRYENFEHEACAAASLGQVHRGLLPDGQKVACKLQYPDMLSAVEADLQQLKLIFAIYKRYDSAIDPGDVHRELSDRLREELDYGREAQHMRLYDEMLKAEAHIHVPSPVDELTTERLLTMTWQEGNPLLDEARRLEDDLEARNRIALNMFRAWYVPFYSFGVIHGDPHLGNYSIRPDGDVNLLDFGCIRVFPARFVRGVINLYFSLERGDDELAASAYEDLGFENLNREMMETLGIWAKFLYGPILAEGVRPIIDSEKGGIYGAEVANKVHQELKRIGGVKPPREFVLMDRAAVGLGSVFMHLKAEIDWHALFHELIRDFDAEKLHQQQSAALKAVGLKPLEAEH